VLISMATSSGDDLPRQIEFLYSCNRLNVAISRARCLAVIVASPRLLETSCSTIEQLRLVNSFCWAKNFADRQSDHTPIAITLIPSGASTRAEAGRTTDRPLWSRSSDLGPGFFDLPARGSTGGAVISVSQDSLRNLIAGLRISGDLTPANAMPFRPGSTACGIPRPKAHTARKLFL
jgi:hypothetical protein